MPNVVPYLKELITKAIQTTATAAEPVVQRSGDAVKKALSDAIRETVVGAKAMTQGAGAAAMDTINSFSKTKSTEDNIISFLKHLSGNAVGDNMKRLQTRVANNGSEYQKAMTEVGRFAVPGSATIMGGNEILNLISGDTKSAGVTDYIRNTLSDMLPRQEPTILVVNNETPVSQPSNRISNTLGTIGNTAAVVGGTGAVGLSGLSAGAVGAQKLINKYDPFARQVGNMASTFSDALSTNDPKQLLKQYVIEGHRILNAATSKGGKETGYDIIKKVWSMPATSLAMKGRRFDADHYGAFKKSPIDALLQLEKEMYISRGQSAPVSVPDRARGVNPDKETLYQRAKDRQAKVIEKLQPARFASHGDVLTPEMLHTQYAPQYRNLAQVLYDEGDKLKDVNVRPLPEMTAIEKGLLDEAKAQRMKIKGGIRGLSSIGLEDQKKLLAAFFANNRLGQNTLAEHFSDGFSPAISQYRTLASAIGLYADKAKQIKQTLGYIAKGSKAKAITAAGVGATGLATSLLSGLFNGEAKAPSNDQLIGKIRDALSIRDAKA